VTCPPEQLCVLRVGCSEGGGGIECKHGKRPYLERSNITRVFPLGAVASRLCGGVFMAGSLCQ
jgi:hypothetical protein